MFELKMDRKPVNTFNLAEDATLLRVAIKTYTGNCKDKETSQEVADDKAASENRVNLYVSRIAKEDRLPPQQIAGEARRYLDTLGAVWDKDGNRLIPNTILETVKTKLETYRVQFLAAVDTLLGRYEELKDKAKQPAPIGLGDLFDRVGFPEEREIKEKYSFEVRSGVFADPNHLALKHVSPQARAEIEANLRHDYDDKIADIHKQVVTRVQKALLRVSQTLPAFEAGKVSRFEDGMFEGLQEIAEILPALNITGDRTISDIVANVRTLITKMDPIKLRDKKSPEGTEHRKEVVKVVGTLLAKINSGAVKARV